MSEYDEKFIRRSSIYVLYEVYDDNNIVFIWGYLTVVRACITVNSDVL